MLGRREEEEDVALVLCISEVGATEKVTSGGCFLFSGEKTREPLGGGIDKMQTRVEGQMQGVALVETDGGKTDFRNLSIAEDKAGVVNVAGCGEAVFVELAEPVRRRRCRQRYV